MSEETRSRRSIYISDADWAILEAEAAKSDDSVAKLVRVAVRAWIDENAVIDGMTGRSRRTLREMARAWGPAKNPDGTYKDDPTGPTFPPGDEP